MRVRVSRLNDRPHTALRCLFMPAGHLAFFTARIHTILRLLAG